jgi:hypothetical protein
MSRMCVALTLLFAQLAEAHLLPTTFAALPAPAQLQLPRVAACKLPLPHARHVSVKSEYHAIVGNTLLLRDCPLKSQPLLVLPQGLPIQLPPSSGVKLPRVEAMAEFRQAGGVAAAADEAAVQHTQPP